MSDLTPLRKKRATFLWLALITTIYIILFFISLFMALDSFMILGAPHGSLFVKFTLISLFFCTPLSIAVAVFFMCRRYHQQHYSKAYFHCKIPPIIMIISFILITIIIEKSMK